MKRVMFAAIACTAVCALADTPYPMEKGLKAENLKKVEQFREKAYWKGAPLAVGVVDALSGIKRTPDLYPEDGDFTGPVRALLARDEYEGASFVLYGFKDVDDVMVKAEIPGVEADVTVVKVWYQQGTAWGSFFSDPLRRVPTPELMLHDDDLIHVDYNTKENFVRCNYENGTTAYRWVSFGAQAVDHSYDGGIRNKWIHDADTLKPFKVRQGEFKQIVVTFHAPKNAKEGLVKGRLALSSKGAKLCDIPCEVRVLPFELPLPGTFRDTSRRFFVSPYMGNLSPIDNEELAKDMVRHNVRNCLLSNLTDPARIRKAYEVFKRTGFDTDYLFCALPGCGLTTSYPAVESDPNYEKFVNATNVAAQAMKSIREVFGPKTRAYSYGIDEGQANTVRRERDTWKGIHRAGGNTIVATQWHPFILFNLDYANVPRHPRASTKRDVAEAYHAGNPDGILGWYADPHSGPENPDYTRRVYGLQTWRNGYDGCCQYILFRDNWNDFWVPAEAFLRGLMLVYPQDGKVLDTIEFEGVREGMDDVRYATMLKDLAEEARTSANVDVQYAGRASLSWIAQVDSEHSGLEYLRYEMVRRILDLRQALGKK